MKRRNAIKHIGLGLSAGMILPTWLSSCKEDEEGPSFKFPETVVVIGAGAAGLYAADILYNKGVNVKIIEASSRVGGRIRSLNSFDKPTEALLYNPDASLGSDFPIELGAEKIFGSDSTWARLIGQQKVNISDLSGYTNNYFLNTAIVDEAVALNDPDFNAALQFLINLNTYTGGNISVEEAINASAINPSMHRILNSWIGNKAGTNNSRVSLSHLVEAINLLQRDNKELLLARNPMQDVLISRFNAVASKVVLNRVVRSVNYAGEKISIAGENTSGGKNEPFSIEADRVLITVPLSVLKGDIGFNPALPSTKSTAISNMGMDASIRVILDFKQNFWGQSSAYIYGGSVAPEYFNSGFGRSSSAQTLSVTINGERAEQLSVIGRDIVPLLLDELDDVYNGKATLNIRRDFNDDTIAVVYDWSKEPFIKGYGSYIKPGGSNQDRIALASSLNNRLFFAGEATDVNGEAGTVNGALLSGERAATEILNSLQA